MTDVRLVSCTSCAAYSQNGSQVATFAVEVDQPQPWHCKRCQPGMVPVDELAVPNRSVGLVDHSPGSRWVVLERDGDWLTVRPLGLPEWPSRTVHINEVRLEFSYERLAQVRARGRS